MQQQRQDIRALFGRVVAVTGAKAKKEMRKL